ncbi:Ig-like domain-containing protein [Blautia faecis]|uniref:Ig-like domain-containing protein n=1 Tax=Blautia faecis TaxID=871665 RepID=UPI001D017D7B|nr:Ig-like domain-containing protein [Blautia faecis]
MGSSSRGSGLSGRNCLRESHYRITGDYNLQINPPEEEPEPEVAIPKIEIAVGETTELTTELTTDSSSDNISWVSTDPSVIVVFNTGTVMGLKSGTALAAGIPTDGSPIILYQILVQ